MSDSIIFALTCFKGFFDAQPFQALIFEANELGLVKRDSQVLKIRFEELEWVELVHSRSLRSSMLPQLGGLLTRPKSDLFRFSVGGKTYELALEIDAFHRKHELKEALIRLYRAEVKVKERTGSSKMTFLLSPMSTNEIEKAIQQLLN